MIGTQGRLIGSLIIAGLLLAPAAFGQKTDTFKTVGDWQASIFGDIGGTDVITPDNFVISGMDESTVQMAVKNDRGKIASTSEGIAYYYRKVAADADFELSATVKVGNFAKNNQVSFGIMLRDQILEYNVSKTALGSYLAVGPAALTAKPMQYTFRRDGSGLNRIGDMVKSPPLAPGVSYFVSFKKTGATYILRWGDEDPLVVNDFTALAGPDRYIGLFAARNAVVSFSDVIFKTGGRSVTDIVVDPKTLQSIYQVGQTIDVKALKVSARYNDGKTEALTDKDFVVTSFDTSQAGKFEFELSSGGFTKKVTYQVAPLIATALSVRFFPLKTDYTADDLFDPIGIVVQATYNQGYRTSDLDPELYDLLIAGQPAAGYKFSKGGAIEVTARFKANKALTTTFPVTVKAAALVNLAVATQPAKVKYFVGDRLDTRGLVVQAVYADGSRVRLEPAAYKLGDFDTRSAGTKALAINHKGKQTTVRYTVQDRKALRVELDRLPATTYNIGEKFDPDNLVASLVYDNGDRERLGAQDYRLDAAALNTAKPGNYTVKLIPTNSALPATPFTVVVRQPSPVVWKSTSFGQSTKPNTNQITMQGDGSVQIAALEGGGKITGDHDGISYYYVDLDALNDNFELRADFTVTDFAKSPGWDGQEAFGIMARDVIGTPNDSSVFASNIVGVGGFSGGSKSPIGTQLFVRTGVQSPDGRGSLGVRRWMLREERPTLSNTSPVKPYQLTLKKTNSGFVGRLDGGGQSEAFAWEPDVLMVQSKRMYVGFFTARLATITVQNIALRVTAVQADLPRKAPPPENLAPALELFAVEKTAQSDFTLTGDANVAGVLTVKQGVKTLVADQPVKPEELFKVKTTLPPSRTTPFSITLVPDDTQALTSADPVTATWEVTTRSYRNGADIFVAPEGLATGDGSEKTPLDLDTALAFVAPGQKVVVKDGRYRRGAALVIPKQHDGLPNAVKSLVAAPGAKPVIDFDKRSAGFTLGGNYWLIKGLDFTNSAANTVGFNLGGNYNTVDSCRFYANGDTGFSISRVAFQDTTIATWPSNNLVIRCEAFDNRDPSENNADGFAAKLTVGKGNVFRDCISHNNADDGWDLYTKVGLGPIGEVLVDHCLAYNNGTLTDGTVTKGDGNGFKLGGEGVPVVHVIRNSLSFKNRATGVSCNSNPAIKIENVFTYDNGRENLDLHLYTGVVQQFKVGGFYSFRTGTGPNDYKLAAGTVVGDNYLFADGTSVNDKGSALSKDVFLTSLEKAGFSKSLLQTN